MFKFFKNKILIATFILLTVIVCVYFLFNYKSEKTQEFCSANDDYVIGVVNILQNYYQENGFFPVVESTVSSDDKNILSLIKNQYEVNIFSNTGPRGMFAYFKRSLNCKLQVLPINHFTYPIK